MAERGGALVVRGEPGIGNTTLLEYLADGASACVIARLRGVESDVELAFGGLHKGTRGIRRGGQVPRGGPRADVRSAAASLAGASGGAGKACVWRARPASAGWGLAGTA